MKEILIRTAQPEDAERLLEIYAPYVRETAITFEYDVPGLEEFRGRIEKTLESRPYLVAEKDGEIIGYAYTGVFKDRAAYDWAEEVSIYVAQDQRRSGVGKRLYEAIEEISAERGIRNMYACIAVPAEEEDPYLTWDSVRFHEYMGYKTVGTFNKCGYKFRRWYSMVWMEKMLGDHPELPGNVVLFRNLKENE